MKYIIRANIAKSRFAYLANKKSGIEIPDLLATP